MAQKNRVKKSWDSFNVGLYLKYLKNKLTFTTMSKLQRLEGAVAAINAIPNNKFFVYPLIDAATNNTFIVSCSYDGVVITDEKKLSLKKYINIILEVYNLEVGTINFMEAEEYTTAVVFTVK